MTAQAKKITPSAKVVIYTFNTGTNVFPTFNEGYTYIYNDKDNGDGTTTRTIYSGDGVTLPTTMDFEGCTDLLSAEYVNGSGLTTAYQLFRGCTNLTYVSLSDFDKGNITEMHFMFYNCNNLVTIDGLENINTSNVNYMHMVFRGCQKLTSLDLTSWDISNATEISSLCSDCTNLTSVNLSTWNTSNVTAMQSMFSGCTSLTELDLSNFNTSKVTYMSYMFGGCTNLTTLDISGWNINTDIYFDLLDGCTNLNKIKLLNSNATTIDRIIERLPSRTSSSYGDLIIYPVFSSEVDTATASSKHWNIVSGIKIAEYTFNSSTDTLPTFNEGFTYTYTDVDNGDGTITRTIISETLPSSISFKNKTGITSLSYLDTSNVTGMFNMFYNCKNLTSLDVSSFNTSKVTSMYYMFYDCNKLTSLDVSNFDTSNVTDMSYMFRNCSNLTSLDVSNFDTSKVTKMSWMFAYCTNLTSLNLSNFNTSKVTKMDNMFNGSNNLISIDLSNFDTGKVTNMNSVFTNCNNLIKIRMKNNNIDTINKIIDALPIRTEYGVVNLMGNKKVSGTNYNTAKNKYWKVYYRDSDRPFILKKGNTNTKLKNISRH